jgi:hypothetical protein
LWYSTPESSVHCLDLATFDKNKNRVPLKDYSFEIKGKLL